MSTSGYGWYWICAKFVKVEMICESVSIMLILEQTQLFLYSNIIYIIE